MRSLVVAVLIAAAAAAPAQAASRAPVTIDVLSNRPDLVSGGDALVQIQRPADAATAKVKVDVAGRDVTKVFADNGGGRLVGLVNGLVVGPNELTATLPDGRGAHLTITNHPIGGPVFSGPQIEPWVCNTQN